MYDENLLSVLFLQEASRDALGKVVFHKKGHESQSILFKENFLIFSHKLSRDIVLFIYLFIYFCLNS